MSHLLKSQCVHTIFFTKKSDCGNNRVLSLFKSFTEIRVPNICISQRFWNQNFEIDSEEFQQIMVTTTFAGKLK